MKKNTIPWVFAVIILFFLLVLSIVLGLTGFYFSVSYMEGALDIRLGETASVVVDANQTGVLSMVVDGAYLPEMPIKQVVQIMSRDMDKKLILRIKSEVFGCDGKASFGFITTEHFEQAEDGYYYYDSQLSGGEKITFCNYIVVPEDVDVVSGEKYILTIVVETLDEGLSQAGIW